MWTWGGSYWRIRLRWAGRICWLFSVLWYRIGRSVVVLYGNHFSIITGRGLDGKGGIRLIITRRGRVGGGGNVLVITFVGWYSGGVGGCSRTIIGDGVRGGIGLESFLYFYKKKKPLKTYGVVETTSGGGSLGGVDWISRIRMGPGGGGVGGFKYRTPTFWV